MYVEKLPPQDAEAEEAVVGSLLIDGSAVLNIAHFLKPDDFSRERNRLCYEACLAIFLDRSEAINQVTVAHELARRNQLESVGGAAYLGYVVSRVPTSVHIKEYAQIVHRTAMMRRLIDAAGKIAGIGYDGGPDVDAALARCEDILFKLRVGEEGRDFSHIRDILRQYTEEESQAKGPRPGAPHSIPTGFIDLDKLLGGLQRSDLVILAARTSVGKSSLALNIAHHASLRGGAHVGIFSLEMGKEQVAQRLLSSQSGIDTYKLRLRNYSEQDERKVMDAIGVLSEAPIWIDDTPSPGLVEMRSKAKRLRAEVGVDLVIVDYMGLVKGDGYQGNRVQEMSLVSRTLKALARDLEIPVLALCQLSRAPEMRPSHKPQLSDLRDSGSIEQDADVVIFIYREDIYFKQEDWERQYPDRPYPKGIAEVSVAKHRHGPIGEIQLYFDERVASFRNLQADRK